MITTDFFTEPTFKAGQSTTLFDLPAGARMRRPGGGNNLDVLPGDQRFMMARNIGAAEAPSQLMIVLDFFEELKRLVPH